MPVPSSGPPERAEPGIAAVAPFFLSSFVWNFALGMTFVLIPLYARSLGMPGTQIGALLALPVVLQIAFTLVGGALADRVGGKQMAMVSCVMTCIAGGLFMVSAGFALMLAAQLLMVTGRAMFWPATWSLASQLPGNSARQMGRLNGATNSGQIFGTAAAGFIIAAAGYTTGFAVMTAAGFAALILNQMYRATPLAPRTARKPAFAIYRMLIGNRAIRYSILCAFISALPVSLSFSFYPILLVEQGFDSDTAGTLISLRGVGAVVAGFVAGYFIGNVRRIATPLSSAVVVGAAVALTAAVSQAALIGVFLFVVGVGSAFMTLYFQMLIGVVSTTETRGSAMALGGLGWGISHLFTPLVMGVLKDHVGTQPAFYLVGAGALLLGLALVPLQRWAFAAEAAVPDRAAAGTVPDQKA